MQEISRLQTIKVSDNLVVVRYYDVKKDCFVKLHAAKHVYKNGNLLVIGDRVFYDYKGKFYEFSSQKNMQLLMENKNCTHKLWLLQRLSSGGSAPELALLRGVFDGKNTHLEILPAWYHTGTANGVKAFLFDATSVKFSFENKCDEEGKLISVDLVMNILNQ